MIINYINLFLITVLLIKELNKPLNILQQNVYNQNNRYLNWIKKNISKTINIYYIIILLISIINIFIDNLFIQLLYMFTIIFVYNYNLIISKKIITKIKFNITSRIKRLYITFMIIILLICLLTNIYINIFIYSLLLVFNYLLIYILFIINKPVEHLIYKYYYNKASNKIDNLNINVIGITGSYGKTSTKNIVNDILNIKYVSRTTKKSYNTDVGLMLTVNNELNNMDEFFVAEMAAYTCGRIKNVCNLVKPKYGALTTIGDAHLETFGSRENIINTKFELIESLPSDGVAFLNMDDINQVNYKLKNNCKVIWYSSSNEKADYYAKNIKAMNDGCEFDICFKDKCYKFKTKLLGVHNISNIVLAVSIGDYFNVDIDKMIKKVKSLKQTEHRLEIKNLGNFIQIDDAYNSNPVGCKSAIDTLRLMDGFKVVVTPGMIELADKEYEENFIFGSYMSDVADLVILVGKNKTKAIYDGLIEKNYNKDNIKIVNNVYEAYDILNKMKCDKKIYALFENDLPDIYNEEEKK